MCGIAGAVFQNLTDINVQFVTTILNSMHHRGPDGKGWFAFDGTNRLSGIQPQNIAQTKLILFHTRLSIIDLSADGHQPMISSNGRYVLTYNGEIYNYLELKGELASLGYIFKTKTDSEVLLAAYSHWDVAAFTKFEGMFAFGIFDTLLNKLILVRDFFGIKPLYYCVTQGNLYFASEIKTLLQFPGVNKQVNPQNVYEYLRFGLTDHNEQTMLKDIHQLPPAHYIEIDLQNLVQSMQIKQYWQINNGNTQQLSLEEAASQLKQIFSDNIIKHLRSDVTVGTALSGGIDSSAIVSTIKHSQPELSVNTFSYIAQDPNISEEQWIDLVAKHTNVKSYKIKPTAAELFQDLDKLILAQDEPFGSTSIYAQYRVFQLAKDTGVKVLLDGQGADEIFGGYYPYLSAQAVSLFRQYKWFDLIKFIQAAKHLPSMNGRQLLFGAMDYVLTLPLQKLARKFINKEFTPAWLNMTWFIENQVTIPLLRKAKGKQVLIQELHRSIQGRGLGQLLRYEDRNSMAFSIESRVPFLTPKLVNFALSLPEHYIIDLQATTKAVFRQAMQGILPEALLQRKDKVGFQTPEKAWLTSMNEYIMDVLSVSQQDIAWLNIENAKKDWHAIVKGNKPFTSNVWRWINLIRWTQLHQIKIA